MVTSLLIVSCQCGIHLLGSPKNHSLWTVQSCHTTAQSSTEVYFAVWVCVRTHEYMRACVYMYTHTVARQGHRTQQGYTITCSSTFKICCRTIKLTSWPLAEKSLSSRQHQHRKQWGVRDTMSLAELMGTICISTVLIGAIRALCTFSCPHKQYTHLAQTLQIHWLPSSLCMQNTITCSNKCHNNIVLTYRLLMQEDMRMLWFRLSPQFIPAT